MTLLQFVQRGKTIADSPRLDETALGTETDRAMTTAMWVDWINDAKNFAQNKIIELFEDFLVETTDITITSGTETYTLPANTLKIRLIEREGVASTETDRELFPISMTDKFRYSNANGYFSYLNSSEFYYIWGNTIGIKPEPNTAGTRKIWYIKKLPDLSYGTAAAAASTTITLAATPSLGTTSNVDDYYNGSSVYIVSASTGAGQTVKITDYVGSTRVATVETFGTTPTGTIVYDIVCEIPESHHKFLVLDAALNACLRDDEAGRYEKIEKEREKHLDNMTKALTQRQIQKAEYVDDGTDGLTQWYM